MKTLMQLFAVTLSLFLCAQANAQTPSPSGDTADIGWPGFNGGYDAARFSPLTQINTKNVGQLTEVARFKIPETMSFQSEPVGGGISTYILGGKQYVAAAGGMKNPIVQIESGPAWVAIFALPDHS